MLDFLGGIFASIFGNNSILATLIISMFPIIELKGAIPIGMSVDFWGEYALNGDVAFAISLVGSSIVVPIIALIFTPFLNALKKTKIFSNIASTIDEKVTKHKIDIQKKTSKKSDIFKCLLLGLFVAVPLPLTGVWTGTCVGVAIGLKFWQVVISVVTGNIIAGLIIKFVCGIFPQIVSILAIVFMFIVIVLFAIFLFKILKKRGENSTNNSNTDVVN